MALKVVVVALDKAAHMIMLSIRPLLCYPFQPALFRGDNRVILIS